MRYQSTCSPMWTGTGAGDVARLLQVVAQHREGGRGEILDVLVLTFLDYILEVGNRALVVLDHLLHVRPVERLARQP